MTIDPNSNLILEQRFTIHNLPQLIDVAITYYLAQSAIRQSLALRGLAKRGAARSQS